MTATDRPSDRAIAQAFWEDPDVRVVSAEDLARWIRHRAREIDAAPINPQEIDSKSIVQPSAEHWRRAVQQWHGLPIPDHEWEAITWTTAGDFLVDEQRARELAKEQSRGR